MKKYGMLILGILLTVTLTACGNSTGTADQAANAKTSVENNTGSEQTAERDSDTSEETVKSDSKVLVAYFAYSENMGDTTGMEADAVSSASLNRSTNNSEGNLQVMAEVIRAETGADVFHIQMTEPYDPDYSTMLPVAIDQMENEKWPALQEKIENLEDYDVVYLGTPVWNSVLPPALHTFFSENDMSGKTIIPFGIHLGSGFGRMIDEMKELAPQADVTEGFTINASTANDEVESEFRTWLTEKNLVS